MHYIFGANAFADVFAQSSKVRYDNASVGLYFLVYWSFGFYKTVSEKINASSVYSLFLIPVFIYSLSDYSILLSQAKHRARSIQQTRIEPADRIKQSVKEYSVIGLQYPELSYPPIFEYPFVFGSQYLQFQFLDKQALSKLYPPDTSELKKHFNYILLSNKEKDFHLLTMRQYSLDTLFIQQWENFYDSLSYRFATQCFSSSYDNYGVSSICLYHISDSVFYKGISDITASDSSTNDAADLYWSYKHLIGSDAYNFQIQISDDSLMRWLVYGSRDGYPTKYRAKNNPYKIKGIGTSFIPDKISRAFDDGKFDFAMDGVSANDRKVEIENFFAGILLSMKESNITFQQAMQQKLKTEAQDFLGAIESLYKKDILQMHTKDYLQVTQLGIDTNALNSNLNVESVWKFSLPVKLKNGKSYYWRVRFKDKYVVLSRWSNTACFKK